MNLKCLCLLCKGCFFFKFGVEESIVNEPLVLKTNNAKSEVRFKQRIRVVILWCVHNRLFNANFDATFKKTPLCIYSDESSYISNFLYDFFSFWCLLCRPTYTD
jgi:hypothetical protein